MLKPVILMLSISAGAAVGWKCGSAGGLMGSYLASVLGATIGLLSGRKIQRFMAGD